MNWAMIAVIVTVCIWGIGILFFIGVTHGKITTRLEHLESLLGNGKPGVFIRRDEVNVWLEKAAHDHELIDKRFEAQDRKIEQLHLKFWEES